MRPYVLTGRVAGIFVALALGAGLGLNACTGLIGGEPDESCVGCTPETTAASEIQSSRYPRLSHLQWENTIRDLFYLPATSGLSSSFTGDTLGGVFDNNEAVLVVTPNLWADYQTAAEAVADLIADDPAALARILPPNLPTDPTESARAFIQHFGKRVYRRPLATEEVDRYLALFQQGPQLFPTTDPFVAGVKLDIRAFLQSPNFVYRVESSSLVATDQLIHLSGWEIGTKLSYLMWNTMPDDALFTAAESGKLDTPEGILDEARRMLADDRAKPMVSSFHEQLYQYDHYGDLNKDATLFPTFTVDIEDDLKREAELFIEDVVFGDRGLYALLTEPFTYVNDELAAIYGLTGSFGPDLVRVDLDPAQRAGFLTRLGFLASNATPREQHTIHRGVFINLRVLCNVVPSPPDVVPGLPPAENFNTNRERVEAHTGAGTCAAGCHQTLVNPPGYALEHYNAIGAYQDLEKGFPVNATADFSLDGQPVSFDGAIEMSALFAQSDQVHRCYAKHWLEYGFGRESQKADDLVIGQIAAQSKVGSVKDLILALTQSVAFRTRAQVKEVTP